MEQYRANESELLGWIDSLANWGRWGKDDELGTLNNLSPELTKKAMELVKDGTAVSCAAPLVFNEASIDAPRAPVHFMVGAGEAYRPGDEMVGQQMATDFSVSFSTDTLLRTWIAMHISCGMVTCTTAGPRHR